MLSVYYRSKGSQSFAIACKNKQKLFLLQSRNFTDLLNFLSSKSNSEALLLLSVKENKFLAEENNLDFSEIPDNALSLIFEGEHFSDISFAPNIEQETAEEQQTVNYTAETEEELVSNPCYDSEGIRIEVFLLKERSRIKAGSCFALNGERKSYCREFFDRQYLSNSDLAVFAPAVFLWLNAISLDCYAEHEIRKTVFYCSKAEWNFDGVFFSSAIQEMSNSELRDELFLIQEQIDNERLGI